MPKKVATTSINKMRLQALMDTPIPKVPIENKPTTKIVPANIRGGLIRPRADII
jgi:hypothetical protein